MALNDNPISTNIEAVSSVSPLTGASQSFLLKGQDETMNVTPAGTIAAFTVVFPEDAASRLGQTISLVSHQIVTSLTVTANGNTINGTAVTALAVDTLVAWRKIAASTWQRLQ